MRLILTILLYFAAVTVNARTFYVKTGGDDGLDGLSDANAWGSISKVNSATYLANDTILFKKGNIFYGSIVVNRNNLNFGAYGVGLMPVITGFTTASSWSNDGGGIWHSNVSIATASLIAVEIDGSLQRIGRTPNFDSSNGGYRTMESVNNGALTITDNQLGASPSWVGAEVVMRKNRWIIDRCIVTAHSGNTITYTNPTGVIGSPYGATAGYGYFFQNSLQTLDKYGEWYFNNSTKDLSIYFGAEVPSSHTIKVSTVSTLFVIGSRTNIVIDGINFTGSNSSAIYSLFGQSVTIKNCKINNTYDAINMNVVSTVNILNDTVKNILNTGIQAIGYNASTAPTNIIGNYLDSINLFEGMGGSGDGVGYSIRQQKNFGTVSNNTVKNSGYIAINYGGSYTKVYLNYVDTFCVKRDDGAGIYTALEDTCTNREVYNNIVLNGIGAPNGTTGSNSSTNAYYTDDNSNGVLLRNNTGAWVAGAGFYSNGAQNYTVRGNLIYGSDVGISINRRTVNPVLRSTYLYSNILYANTTNIHYQNQILTTPSVVTIQQDMRLLGNMDSNYYRGGIPLEFDWIWCPSCGTGNTDIDGWKTWMNMDANLKKISDSTVTFHYNTNLTDSTLVIVGTKKDINNISRTGTIVIPARSGILLFNDGVTNSPPIANAGADQTITLPIDYVTLSGAGSAGTSSPITTYAWTKISGTGGTILMPSGSTTVVSGLTSGIYVFRLTVTDANSLTDSDDVQVTVNPAVVPPTPGVSYKIYGWRFIAN